MRERVAPPRPGLTSQTATGDVRFARAVTRLALQAALAERCTSVVWLRVRGVEDIVTFTGRVPFNDAPYYLAACDIATAPKMSSSEGSGKLLNYMAMAQPIVAYDTAVNREYLADLGVYATPGDVGSFTNAIADLIHDPGRRAELGEQLRRRVMEQFSWDAAAGRIFELYELLDKRRHFV